MHGLRIGVYREKRCAEPRNAFDAPGDGVTEVVQLEIEEDALAGAGQHACEVEPPRKSKLITDLVERDSFAEPCDQCLRLGDRRHVEGHDQPLARVKLHGRSPSRLLRRSSVRRHARSFAVSTSLRMTSLS